MATDIDYSPIPEDIRDVYRGLENELVFLTFQWSTFHDLFAKNPVRLQLLMETAASFFFDVHALWVDATILHLCRMSDPAQQAGRDNLVLQQLVDAVQETADQTFVAGLQKRVDAIEAQVTPLRKHRNRRIAHLDRETVLQDVDKALPQLKRQDLSDLLTAVQDFMNFFRMYFLKSRLHYSGGTSESDVEGHVYDLKRAYEYARLEEQDVNYIQRVEQGKFREA